MRRRHRWIGLLALLLLPAFPSRAEPAPGQLCLSAILAAQSSTKLPRGLLGAIGQVESGRADPVSGAVRPWPWTINAEGQPAFFASKAAAVAAVSALQARGATSIDVGCMQVNLMHHPLAFASLDQAFDPGRNAAYAARFLTRLFAQTRDWPSAAALYHSATPGLAEAYQRRVLAAWGVPVPPRVAIPPRGRLAVMLPAQSGQAIRVLALP